MKITVLNNLQLDCTCVKSYDPCPALVPKTDIIILEPSLFTVLQYCCKHTETYCKAGLSKVSFCDPFVTIPEKKYFYTAPFFS